MMTKEKAIELLQRQISEIGNLTTENLSGWTSPTRGILEKIFGHESGQLGTFDITPKTSNEYEDNNTNQQGRVQRGPLLISVVKKESLTALLRGYIREIEDFGIPEQDHNVSVQKDALITIENICKRFHAVARQLRKRHDNRPTFDISDEYDVQDLLHALLRIHFDDIRPEEWTPSYAGKSARMDFLLKNEEIVIEVKKSRLGLGAKEVGDELIIDINRYQAHPNCKTLVCFVYDPEGRIANPIGPERDLYHESDTFSVRIFIYPKV